MTLRPPASSLPRGFSYAAVPCGLKKSGRDLALLVSEIPAHAAALFTTNLVQAAPVILSRAHLARAASRARAIIVNSGNANCATGPAGLRASHATARAVANALGCHTDEILVCSTGVIGVPLHVEKILCAIPRLADSRREDPRSFAQLTRAIMTTDTRPKWAAARCRIGGSIIRILGCAKGAGMIEPRLATMLAFVATDAAISHALLRRALTQAAKLTFNAITVDGDTSTNDTLAILANGASGAHAIRSVGSDFNSFVRALEKICRDLSLAIVADGEGARRVIEIEVCGAPSERAAMQVARTIANSPLVKTAFAGADPNWGRILAAAGRSGITFDPRRASVSIAGTPVCRHGVECRFSEKRVHQRMLAKFVPVVLDLGAGGASGRVWTCDFTGDYVRINASYRT